LRRTLRAGLAAAGLLGAARAEETGKPPPPPIEVLESGSATVDAATGAFELEGGALLRRGELTLRAPRATWDPAARTLSAEGGALLGGPGRMLSAESLRLTQGGAFEARGVRAWLKDRPLDLTGCATGEEAERRGRNRVSFSGERLSGRDGEDALVLEGARITLCDCAGGAPSWEIRASRADVEPGSRAILKWPVLYVTPRFLGVDHLVPVLALPWGYLPLAERKSGLLLPELAFDRNGLSGGLPVFLALSRSWDATVTPQWITGPSRAQRERDQRGVRGPGLGLELRWAPDEGASGLARAHLVRSTLSAWPEDAWRPPDGQRMALQLAHRQGIGSRADLAADLSAVGDPFYVADFTGDLLLRGADYRRSAAALSARGPGSLLALEASYLEPLAYLRSGAPGVRAPFGPFGGDLSTFHRLPAISAVLLPRQLAGPLRVEGRVELARFAPLRGASGDEGADGVGPGERGWGDSALARRADGTVLPLGADAGERDGRWQPGEREAATRALARLELSAPIRAGRCLELEPWLAAAGAGYSFEGPSRSQADARASGGLALSTELARTFGQGEGRIRHALEPRVEWRAGTRGAGRSLPSGWAYDDQDLAAPAGAYAVTQDPPPAGPPNLVPRRALSAAPAGGWQQLRISLRNRLVAPDGKLSRAALDLDLGQDLDLEAGRRAEAFVALALRTPLATLDAGARFWALGAGRPPGAPEAAHPSSLDRLSELRASLSVGGPRLEAHASFLALGPGASQRLAAGADPFFDPRPLPFEPLAQGSAGFRARWSAATLAYDADFNARTLSAPPVANGRRGPHVWQQTAQLGWDSPCRCFRIGVLARLKDGDSRPSAYLTLSLNPAGEAREAAGPGGR
jgi:LPS-assembly protein